MRAEFSWLNSATAGHEESVIDSENNKDQEVIDFYAESLGLGQETMVNKPSVNLIESTANIRTNSTAHHVNTKEVPLFNIYPKDYKVSETNSEYVQNPCDETAVKDENRSLKDYDEHDLDDEVSVSATYTIEENVAGSESLRRDDTNAATFMRPFRLLFRGTFIENAEDIIGNLDKLYEFSLTDDEADVNSSVGASVNLHDVKESGPNAHELLYQTITPQMDAAITVADIETKEKADACQSLRAAPREQTTTKSGPVGFKWSAGIIKSDGQLIFIAREKLSNFTVTKIIPNERVDSVREAIILSTAELIPPEGLKIQVDNASGMQYLVGDSNLGRCNISIQLARKKNKDGNPVAEKAVQEFKNEKLKFRPSGGVLNDIDRALITASLNRREQNSKLSAREIITTRDQNTGHIYDDSLALDQLQRRLVNHSASAKSKVHKDVITKKVNVCPTALVTPTKGKSKHRGQEKNMVVRTGKEIILCPKQTLPTDANIPSSTPPHLGCESPIVSSFEDESDVNNEVPTASDSESSESVSSKDDKTPKENFVPETNPDPILLSFVLLQLMIRYKVSVVILMIGEVGIFVGRRGEQARRRGPGRVVTVLSAEEMIEFDKCLFE